MRNNPYFQRFMKGESAKDLVSEIAAEAKTSLTDPNISDEDRHYCELVVFLQKTSEPLPDELLRAAISSL